MSINNVTLMGRLTADAELKNTQSGVSVVNFTIAVDRKYQPSGEEKKANFIDCVAWRGTAEFISKYFGKGQMIAIEGEIQTDSYTDKDGNNRKKTEIVVSNASFCGAKSEGGQAQNTTLPDVSFSGTGDDDLPF